MGTKFQFFLLDPFSISNDDFVSYMKFVLPQLHRWNDKIFDVDNADDPDFRQAVMKNIDQNYSCLGREHDVSIRSLF